MSKEIVAFHRRLHRWYDTHGRKDLPWRNTIDAYAIYVSEIMLQQTQVATVLERYYHPFLKRFPTLKRLAAATQDEVLHAWQGLGYYNRALNLHKAAKQAGNALPDSVDGLIALPGIGHNTAHAIAAFAYHQPVAVMEANVRRVLSRIFALQYPTEQELWENAALLLDTKNPFDYNQAMMDIGSMVCTRRAPRCAQCPANAMCAGKDAPESYPLPAKKKTPPVRKKNIAVLRNAQGKYYAAPRTGKFLNGLYHFVEIDADASFSLSSLRKQGSCSTFRIPASAGMTKIGSVRQQYSHFTLEADIWLVASDGKGTGWYSLKQLLGLPMSMAEKKILALLL